MRRLPWLGLGLGLALWALSIAVKVPVVGSPPYWDEGLHYYTARHLTHAGEGLVDIWGNAANIPHYLVYQRPAFYLAFWGPAQGGFEAFRATHAIAASLLAPLSYAVLRAHGIRRPAAVAAGVAVAVVPSIAMWGNLGLMDSMMTVWLAVALWARAMGRNALMGAALVAAVWTKETAYAAVLGLLAFEGFRGWVQGTWRFLPLQLDRRGTALVFAAALGPWPLMWAVSHDLALPGAVNHGSIEPLLDRVMLTPYLVPIVVAGLWRARSRFLCGWSLASAGLLILLQLAARDVPQWYEVPTTVFAVIAAFASADAFWRTPPARVWALKPVAAAAAVLLVALLVLLPHGDARDRLRPLSGDGANNLQGSWDFESNIRDADLHAALAQLPRDGKHDVLDIDVAPPAMFPTVESVRTMYVDSSFFRTLFEFDSAPLAKRIEDPETWTIVDRSELPMAHAVEVVYGDCTVYRNAGFLVIQGSACAGRADELERTWRGFDPRF